MSYIKEWPDALLIVLEKSILPSRIEGNPTDPVEREELAKIKDELKLRRKQESEECEQPTT